MAANDDKREMLEKLLDAGMVMVTLDGRAAGVDVPQRFQDDPQLALNLSYRFGLSMQVDDWGIRATLTFGGQPHLCKLPWGSIYQAFSHVTGEQLLFPEDLPADLLEALSRKKDAPAEAAPAPKKARPRFQVVDGGGERPAREPLESLPSVGEGEEEAEARPQARPSHLRRIK